MRNFNKENLRPTTIRRNEEIMRIYDEEMGKLGEYKYLVPKSYIYNLITKRTGYCIRKIEDTINHYTR